MATPSRRSLVLAALLTTCCALAFVSTARAGSFTNCGEVTIGTNSTAILKVKRMKCGNGQDLGHEVDQRIRDGEFWEIGDTTSIRRFRCERLGYFDPFEPSFECVHTRQKGKKLKALYPPEREPVATAAKNRIFGTNGCGGLDVTPGRVIFACADVGLFAADLKWRRWGDRKAKGEGTLFAKVCEPDCASGYFERFPVTLIFRAIKTESCEGRRVRMYTRFKMQLPGAEPESIDPYRRGPLTAFC